MLQRGQLAKRFFTFLQYTFSIGCLPVCKIREPRSANEPELLCSPDEAAPEDGPGHDVDHHHDHPLDGRHVRLIGMVLRVQLLAHRSLCTNAVSFLRFARSSPCREGIVNLLRFCMQKSGQAKAKSQRANASEQTLVLSENAQTQNRCPEIKKIEMSNRR